MKLYYGKSEDDKILVKDVATNEEAAMEMRYQLTEIGYGEAPYWRMWYSEDGSYSTYDFGSWSYFFFLYK